MTVLLFPLELVHFIRTQKNPTEKKFIQDDLAQKKYEALALNGFYEYMVRQPAVQRAMKKPHHQWHSDTALLASVYRAMLENPALEKLMASEPNDFQSQAKFMNRLFTYLRDNEEFDTAMEEIEMLWVDEKIPIHKAIRTALSSVDENTELALPISDEKDVEGLSYSDELLTLSSRHMKEYGDLIDANAPGWDRDRIAKTDMILMTMALTELIHFPYIPIKVTLNEYLELAKNYSTPQSSKFVNGVLDKLVSQLKEDKKLVKKGRGMIE